MPVALAAILLASGCEDDRSPSQTQAHAPTPATEAGETTAKPEVTEDDLGGVPVYEGGEILQQQSSKSSTGKDGSLAMGTFEVLDPPPMVANFYRRKLEEIGAGNPVTETTLPTGTVMLMVDDPAANKAVQVEISQHETGSRVKVIAAEFPTD
jgi:hypothetical protein